MEQSIGAQADWYCPNMVQPDWITFESTDPDSAKSYHVTIAVMYGSAMNEDNLGYKWAVLETRNAFHNMAWFNAPAQHVRENVEYRYRWVVFPYKYSDVLPGTRTTVAQKIAQLRAGYTPTSDLERPVGFVEAVTRDAHVEGWAVDPDTTDPIRVHVFIDGESVGFPWATEARADVNEGTAYPGDHGFSWPIPAVYRDGGTHTVRAAGIDSGSGAEAELGGSAMTFCFDGDAECRDHAH
jgi:hypothetical protein